MECPECRSDHIRKNGISPQGKQYYICVNFSSQFIDSYQLEHGYSDEFKHDGMG